MKIAKIALYTLGFRNQFEHEEKQPEKIINADLVIKHLNTNQLEVNSFFLVFSRPPPFPQTDSCDE